MNTYRWIGTDKLRYLLEQIKNKYLTKAEVESSISALDSAVVKGVKNNEGTTYNKDVNGIVTLDLSAYAKADAIVPAAKVTFDNGQSSFLSKNVQGVLNEVNSRVVSLENQDKIDEAFEIQYDSTISKMSATNVQQAIDEIDARLDDWIMDSSHVSYNGETLDVVLARDIAALASLMAKDVGYSNSVSGYNVNNVQAALDKIYQDIQAIELTTEAVGINYNNTTSHISSANVQAALDELVTLITNNTTLINQTDAKITQIIQDFDSAADVNYDDTNTGYNATNVQQALEAIKTLINGLQTSINANATGITNLTNTTTALDGRLTTAEGKINTLTTAVNTNTTDIGKIDLDTVSKFSTDADGKLLYDNQPVASQGTVYAQDVVYESSNVKDELDSINTDMSALSGLPGQVQTLADTVAALDTPTASDIDYSNTTSGLTATDVQAAIDEIDSSVDTANTQLTNLNTRVTTIENKPVQTAKTESYDHTTSGLTATNTNDAIDEVNAKVEDLISSIDDASMVDYDNTTSGLTATNVQDAIDETITLIGQTHDDIPTDISQLGYDNQYSGLDATTAQQAIDEIASMGGSGGTGGVTYVAKVATYTYTGAGTNTNTLHFDYVPEIVFITGTLSATQYAARIIIGKQATRALISYGTDTNSNGADYLVRVAWDTDFLNSTITAYNADRAMNHSGLTYTVTYIYKQRIATGGSGGGGASSADAVDYDATDSQIRGIDGILVDNVQDAIDRLNDFINKNAQDIVTQSNADNINYTSVYTSLVSTTVADALDELDNKFNSLNGEDARNVNYDNTTSGVDSTTVQNAIDRIFAQLDQLVDDYYYQKPVITSFTANVPTDIIYEKGISLQNVVFTWTTNKTVIDQTLTDISVSADARTATYDGVLDDDKTFVLTVEDSRGATTSATIEFKFGKNIYWGSAPAPADNTGFTSAFAIGLGNKRFAENIQGEFDFTIRSGEYGYIIYPFSFSVISRMLLDYYLVEAKYITTITLTNESGFTYSYYVYRICDQTGLGNVTLRVL